MRLPLLSLALWFCLGPAAASPAVGPPAGPPQGPSAADLPAPLPETTLLRGEGSSGPITLDSVLARVEQNHPKVRGAELTRQIAGAKVQEKLGAFDPQLGVETAYQRYNSSSSPGKPLDYVSNGIVVARQDPSGIKWEGGWLNTQGFPKSPASSTGDVGEFFVQAKVPFLRGAGINDKAIAVEQARLFERQAQEDLRVIKLLTLLDAGAAFLQWNVAVMQWRILKENEQLAIERAAQVASRVKAGDLAAIDQVEAEGEVLKRRELTLKAEREAQKGALKLALYLWASDGRPESVPSPEQAPETLPEIKRLTTDQVYELQLLALTQRPELRKLDLDRSVVSLDKDLAENDRLPQLDLTLRPGYDAGGQGVGFTMKAGLELVIPLGTRGPDGRRQAAVLKLEKLDLDQVELVRRILVQVQDAASEAEAAAIRLEQAQAVYQQAKTLEQAERTKFRLGDSTLLVVNIRERATLEAALKVLDLRYENAQAQLLIDAVVGEL
jgi:outer membrane protein TolC